MKLQTLALALILPVSAQAAQLAMPSFEPVLQELRSTLREAAAERKQVRSQTDAGEIQSLNSETRRLRWDASRYKRDLDDISRRVRNAQRPQPGRPSNDPFLSSDLNRLVWNLRDLERDSQWAESRAVRAAQTAVKDPALVGPAQSLLSSAQWLRSDVDWLERDARWAAMDLRRIGYSMEAWDIERLSADAARQARSIESAAAQILSKVR